MDAVAREAARRADEFKPQELANTVPVAASPYCVPRHAAAATQAWAFATCSRDDTVDARLQKQLFDNIARAAYKRLDRFSDQGLSNLAWAFAAAGEAQRHEKLFGAIAQEAAPRVAEFQPQGFSNLAWCAAASLLRSHLFLCV